MVNQRNIFPPFLLLALLATTTFAQSGIADLAIDLSRLRIGAQGQLQLDPVHNQGGQWPRVESRQGVLWRMVLQTPATPSVPGRVRNLSAHNQPMRRESQLERHGSDRLPARQ